MFLRLIQPCSPVLANILPAGNDWQHEIKFDGFRVQIHKLTDLVSALGSRGWLVCSVSCRPSRSFSMVKL